MDNEWKEIWQQSSDNQPLPVTIDLNKKSLGIVDRIERTIRLEYWFNWAFTVIAPIWFLLYGKALEASIIVVTMPPILYYYYLLLNKLKQTKLDADVQSYLKKAYKVLKAFMNHYKIACVIGGFIGFFWGLSETSHGEYPFQNIDAPKLIGYSMAILGGIGLVYLLIYLMYGRQFKRFEKLVENLEEANE